jgi:hypothetical protein
MTILRAFEPQLMALAAGARGLALLVLVVSWVFPPARWFWRRTFPAPLSPWIPLHQCVRCGRLNAPDASSCLQCGQIFLRGWARWRLSPWGRRLEGWGGLLATLWSGGGWLLFYAVTVPLVVQLRLFAGDLRPWEELTASVTLLLCLLTLTFLRQALALGPRPILSRLNQFIVGGALLGLTFVAGFAWASAPDRSRALAILALAEDGSVTALVEGKTSAHAPAARAERGWRLPVQYGVLSWPLLGLERRLLLRLGARSVRGSGAAWAPAVLSRVLGGEGPGRPHWARLRQTLDIPSPGRWRLEPASSGGGLELFREVP